jgi:hypothetical protein
MRLRLRRRIWRASLSAAFLTALSAGAAACSVASGEGSREPGTPPQQSSAARRGVTARDGSVVYAHRNDLWLFDRASGAVRRLTANGDERIERRPRFATPATVTFLADGDLYELGLGGGRAVKLLDGPILAYTLGPGRATLAYLGQPGGVGRHRLFLYDRRTRGRTPLRRLPGPRPRRGDGSGPALDDEIELAWSPEGGKLLVVDTALAPGPTVYVLRRDGRVLARRTGTHAGWAGSSAIYYRSRRGPRWSLLTLRGGATRTLAVRRGRMHPVRSPDGRLLALDDGRAWRAGTPRRGCTCTVHVYDFAAGVERALHRGAVAPLWLSPSALAATRVRPCRGSECGIDAPMWVSRGTSVRIGVDDGRTTSIRLASTLDANVLRRR